MKKFDFVYKIMVIILLIVLILSLLGVKKEIKSLRVGSIETGLKDINKEMFRLDWRFGRLETYILSIYDKDAKWLVKILEKEKRDK